MESLRLDTDTEVWNIMGTDNLNPFFINSISVAFITLFKPLSLPKRLDKNEFLWN